MTSGAIPTQPVTPLAYVLVGAVDEAALYIVQQTTPNARDTRRSRPCAA
ncbi:MAG: hypothetical protein H0V92_08980 [Pseudonocardiales bacterium]|nr:hypothetical protein [Pseudonocardiales bacterium]